MRLTTALYFFPALTNMPSVGRKARGGFLGLGTEDGGLDGMFH